MVWKPREENEEMFYEYYLSQSEWGQEEVIRPWEASHSKLGIVENAAFGLVSSSDLLNSLPL